MLEATDTDGFLVLHHGRILEERYGGAMTESTPHLLQSVSKSLTSALAGALVGLGRLDPGAGDAYVAELRGGSFEGCTVQDLLDMRGGHPLLRGVRGPRRRYPDQRAGRGLAAAHARRAPG